MEDNEKIDIELWLQYMVAINGDEEKRSEVIKRIAEKGGYTVEKVEDIMRALWKTLLEISRSN